MKIEQPKISCLSRGQLSGFSTERLMHFLLCLAAMSKLPSSPRPHRAATCILSSLPLLDLALVNYGGPCLRPLL